MNSDCGCREALLGLLVGLAIYASQFIIFYPEFYSTSQKILAAFIIGLAGALVGKIVGLIRARYRRGFIVASVSGLIGKLIGLVLSRMRFHFTVRRFRRACGTERRGS
jgi:hypothetical protein